MGGDAVPLKNLQGGILAWAEDIDQTMPKY
jgi:hypothetical protein